MANAELYLAPMPVTSIGNHQPPSQALNIPDAVWDQAKQALLLPVGTGAAFDGRFADAAIGHTQQTVAVNDVAARIAQVVAEYRTASFSTPTPRDVSVGAWSFYYRYLDATQAYVVAHYDVSITTAGGTTPWYLQFNDAGTTHTFLVTAIARVLIPKS
jgi:hypothetical protein